MPDHPHILFLTVTGVRGHNDNHERLPRAFEAAGWRVTVGDHESLVLTPGGLRAGSLILPRFQKIWILGLGHRETFLDRMQMLATLPRAMFVTTPNAFLTLHGKFSWQSFAPPTYASTQAAELAGHVTGGGHWIAKPPAGSFGRDVIHLHRDQPGWHERLAALTGGDRRYVLLQRRVTGVEKRVLVAAGRLIGTYTRLPGPGTAHNLAQGGHAAAGSLDPNQQTVVEALLPELVAAGVGFAGVDLVGDRVLEVNVANPGGLATLEALTGIDPSDEVVQALDAAPEPGPSRSG